MPQCGQLQGGSTVTEGRKTTLRGCHMPPIMRKLIDAATAIGLTAAVVFVIIFTNSFLTARGGSVHGFNTWYAFILRPDILSTMVLTALVTIGYGMWQQGNRPR
jgi:hypothetical protein